MGLSYAATSSILLLMGAHSLNAHIVGHVIEPFGHWFDTKYQQPMGRLALIHSDSVIVRLKPYKTTDAIAIRAYETGERILFDCRTPTVCSAALNLNFANLPRRTSENNVVIAAFGILLDLGSDLPSIYANYKRGIWKRGATEPLLMDGIAFYDLAAGLDVAELFKNAPTDKYYIDICPERPDGEAVCSSAPAASPYAWNRLRPTTLQGVIDRPGVYRLYLCRNIQGTFLRAPEFSLMVVTDPVQGQSLNQLYSSFVSATTTWLTNDPTCVPVRRAYLKALALRTSHK